MPRVTKKAFLIFGTLVGIYYLIVVIDARMRTPEIVQQALNSGQCNWS